MVEAGWERRPQVAAAELGARHGKAWSARRSGPSSGLGPGPLRGTPPGGPGDPAVARHSAGARAELERRARGPAALRCGHPQKKEQGTVTAHKWAPQESWNPNQGAQTWEGSSEGHLSYTRGHHCVHSSHSRLNCEEVSAPPHFQYPKWFENVHRLVTDGFFFFLSLLMVG